MKTLGGEQMILAKYNLDIVKNIVTRSSIIILLIIVLFIVLTIGLYVELHKTKELMKINNELLKDIKNQKLKSQNIK